MSVFLPSPLPTTVDTVADLATPKARTADGKIITTTGRLAIGDGGGGWYIYYRSGRTGVTVDGNVFVAGPGTDDYYKLATLDECKSSQFGTVGDGTTDDRAALLAADAAATAANSVAVTLTPGVYAVASNMTFSNPVKPLDGARLKPANGVVIILSDGFIAEEAQYVFDISAGGSFIIQKASQVSARNFGADPTGVVDSTDELNALFAVAAANDCGKCICDGTYKISDTVYVGPASDAISVAFDHTTDTFTAASHGLSNNYVLRFWTSTSLPTNFAFGVDYYVVNATENTFQLALTLNGTPVLSSSNGSNVRVTLGRNRTKNYQGAMLINCVGTFDTAVFIRFSYYINWKGLIRVYGITDGQTSGQPYSTRTVTNGVVLKGLNHSQMDGFWALFMLGDGVLFDGDPIFTYDNTIGDIFAIDCGSSGVTLIDSFSVVGTWSDRVDSGSSGAFNQLSTITIDTLPPASTDSIKKTLWVAGKLYDVIDIDRDASTVTVFPWLQFRAPLFDYTTDTFTAPCHGLSENDIVRLSGTLPSDFSAGVDYYVLPSTSDKFQLSLTPSGAPVEQTTANNGSGILVTLMSGSYRFIYGSGVRVRGPEAAGNTVHHVSCIRTGVGLAVESLYGPTIGVLQTQAVGIGCIVGFKSPVFDEFGALVGSADAAMVGAAISRFYGESINEFNFVLKTAAAYSVNIDSFNPGELSKIISICSPIVSAWNAPSPTFDGLWNCSFGTTTGYVAPAKPINNSELLSGSANLDVNVNHNASYFSDTFSLGLTLSGDTEADKLAPIKQLGQDSFQFTLFGNSDNGAPRGALTVYPPIYSVPYSFTVDTGADEIIDPCHVVSEDELITFTGSDLPAGLSAATSYYATNVTVDTFQVSLSVGGAAVDITDAGSGDFKYNIQSNWTINDGAKNTQATFTGFVAPTTFTGYLNATTKNIVLRPQVNAALERDNHLGTQFSTTVSDFGITVRELDNPTTYTALLNTANSLLTGDANDDATGDANDLIGAYNGTWVGTAAYRAAPQYKGKAFVFSGTNYITQAAAAGNLTNNFTVACWVKPAIQAYPMRIVSKRDTGPNHAWELYVDGNGALGFGDGGGWLSSYNAFTADAGTDEIIRADHGLAVGDAITFLGGDLPAGLEPSTQYYVRNATTNRFQVSLSPSGSIVNITDTGTGSLIYVTAGVIKVGRWHHVAFVANGASSQLYVDGVAVGTPFNINITIGPSTELVNWGRMPLGGGDSYWIGELFQCGIWNSVLSAGDIALLHDRTLADVLLLGDLGSLGTGTLTYDFSAGNEKFQTAKATGSIALAFTATQAGYYTAIVEIDTVTPPTITYSTSVVGTAPTIDTADNAKTLIPLFFDGSTWFHV